MKNIFRFSALLALCSLIGLAACTPEELSTDQFEDSAVVFGAFAPNPVVRGAELRIMGSNLDKIVEVQIPGAEPITEIELVSAGRVSEIRVVTPKEGAEDASVTGPVVIIDNTGKTYQSMTELSFTEGIVLDSFTPASAMPGDEVTVKGDYLYNVQQIVLNNGVYVTGDQITAKSRRELKFIVPSNAVTGPVTIGDVDENNNPDGLIPNNVPSKDVLTIGDPTVKAADRGMLKAGAQITVQGTYLDMIAKAAFRVTVPAAEEGGSPTVTDTEVEFTLAEDHKSVKLALPASVVEGEVVLTSYAGKEFKAGAYTTVVPTEVAIAAETRYKAGLNAVVTGKDLDLVTGAALAGTALEFAYADGKITFAIPAAAVDGTVVLTLANGKTVETAAIELVKPVITAVTPLELYAGDENIKITGSDLDLVTEATLGGAKEEFEYANDVLTVKTALTSVPGKLELTLANGLKVVAADAVNVKYHSKVIVTEMPAMQHIGQEVVLKGSNFSLVENIFIGEEKVTQYSVRTNEEVRFLMPWNKVGMYKISFLLFDGDTETLATQIEVGLELDIKTIWEGEAALNWSGMTDLSWGGYDWSTVKPGTVLTAYFTLAEADYWQVRFGNGSWASLPSGLDAAPGEGNIPMTPGTTYYAIKLTAADIDMLVNQGGLVMTGANYTLTKLTLTSEISQEVTVYKGPTMLTWGDDGRFGIAMNYIEGLSAGSKMIVYFTQTADWGQVQFNNGWWDNSSVSFPELGGAYLTTDNAGGKDVTKVELTFTQELLDHLKSAPGDYWGLNADYKNGDTRVAFVIQGQNWIIDEITVLP